jgi:hypothetical protein
VNSYISIFKEGDGMSAKKFLLLSLAMLATLVLIVSAIFYYIDPLFYYRKTKLYEPQYIGTERYQMAGLLNTMDYETVFTGTSMGRNFEESYADQKLKTKSFNASLPASTAREQAMVAQTAFRQKEKIERVIWELNYFSFSGEPDKVTGPPSDFPTYMYDDSKINDIRYLFSSYTLQVLNKNVTANKENNRQKRDPLKIYKFGRGVPVASIERIKKSMEKDRDIPELPGYETAETMLRSFKENVLPLVQQHPETTFTFFYAPYPVYNQHMFYDMHPDYIKERSEFKKEAYKLLSQYPNAQLYDFQANKDITFNMDNYMIDGTHYYNFINRWIIDNFAENQPIQDLAQYENLINQYQQHVTNFQIQQLEKNTTLREQYTLLEK